MPVFTPWTTEEENTVRALYPTHTPAQIAEQLPGRTAAAVKGRGFVLGLMRPSRVWSPKEDAYLQAHYATTEDAVIAEHLGVTAHAIKARAGRLGCKKSAAFRSAKVQQGHSNRTRTVKMERSTIKKGKLVKVKARTAGPKPWEYPMNSPEYKAWMESKIAGKRPVYGIDAMNRPTVTYTNQPR